jgi:lysophospholipase L1-like esterase
MNNKITVFVGNNDEFTVSECLKHDANAYLVDTNNYEDFLKTTALEDITIYTSFADLPKITDDDAVIYNVLNKADDVIYVPSTSWSDDFGFSINSQQRITEYFLYLIHGQKHNVKNLDLSEYKAMYTELADQRPQTSDDETLWVAGCSISHGVGVSDDEKYSTIISKTLNLPLCSITKGGSGIDWATDQILRSDIRENDIVIWGLTSEYRIEEWQTTMLPQKHQANIRYSEARIQQAVLNIHQVVNFCNKINAKLIMIPLICTETLVLHLCDIASFYQLPYQTKPLDYGTDGVHPGAKQHTVWAEFCINLCK